MLVSLKENAVVWKHRDVKKPDNVACDHKYACDRKYACDHKYACDRQVRELFHVSGSSWLNRSDSSVFFTKLSEMRMKNE